MEKNKSNIFRAMPSLLLVSMLCIMASPIFAAGKMPSLGEAKIAAGGMDLAKMPVLENITNGTNDSNGAMPILNSTIGNETGGGRGGAGGTLDDGNSSANASGTGSLVAGGGNSTGTYSTLPIATQKPVGQDKLGVKVGQKGPMAEVTFANILGRSGKYLSGPGKNEEIRDDAQQGAPSYQPGKYPDIKALIALDTGPDSYIADDTYWDAQGAQMPFVPNGKQAMASNTYDVLVAADQSGAIAAETDSTAAVKDDGAIGAPAGPDATNTQAMPVQPKPGEFHRIQVALECNASSCKFYYPLSENVIFQLDAYDTRSNLVARSVVARPISHYHATTYYVSGAGRLAASFSAVPSSRPVFYQQDYAGNNVKVTGTGGNVMSSTVYGPFGDIISQSGSMKFKFNSKELDSATGLYYFGARYYDPSIGRFTTADTVKGDISDVQSLNRYAFVKNNPVRYIDPTGNDDVPATDSTDDTMCTENTICEPDRTKVADKAASGPLPQVPVDWTGLQPGTVVDVSNEHIAAALTMGTSIPLAGGLKASVTVGKAVETTLLEKEGVGAINLGTKAISGELDAGAAKLGVDAGVEGVGASASKNIINIPGKLKVDLKADAKIIDFNTPESAAQEASGASYLAQYQAAYAESSGWADARARYLTANIGNPAPKDSFINNYFVRASTFVNSPNNYQVQSGQDYQALSLPWK